MRNEDETAYTTLNTIFKGSIESLYAYSQHANLGYNLKIAPIGASLFPFPSEIETLMTDDYYCQVVTDKGKFVNLIVRSFSNKNLGFVCNYANIPIIMHDDRGNPLDITIGAYYIGDGLAVWATCNEIPNSAQYYIQQRETIEFSLLDAQAGALVNSWLSTHIRSDIIHSHHDRCLEAWLEEKRNGTYD